jgi:hypothetical protein
MTKAYPDAKVVLTNRDINKWQKSMQSSAGVVLSWKTWPLVAKFDPTIVGPWYHFTQVLLGHLCNNDWGEPLRQTYIEHYKKVREVVPKENLLEFTVGQDGWEPLCEFLGKEVPEGDFPRTNDGEAFVQVHAWMYKQAAVKMFSKLTVSGLLAGAVVGAAWFWRVKGLKR